MQRFLGGAILIRRLTALNFADRWVSNRRMGAEDSPSEGAAEKKWLGLQKKI